MKKSLFALFFMVFWIGSTTFVHADMGPKPELRVTVLNAPNEAYYLDLLVDADYATGNIDEYAPYDPVLFQLLKDYDGNGWYSAKAYGTRIPLFAVLEPTLINGKPSFTFGYHLPDRFKIILMTKSGKATVSDEIKLETFYTTMTFDALTGKTTKTDTFILYVTQFLSTFIPTLMVEFVVLLMFGLYSKHNLKVFFIMNLVTQIALTFTVNAALITMGLLSALITLILMEGFIWIFECIVAWKAFDKTRKTGRKIAFALTANMVSFVLGIILLMIQSTW